MSDRKDFLVQEVALISGATTQIGRTIRVSNCDKVTVAFVVSVSAATLQGSFYVGGTNDENSALNNGAVALPAVTAGATSILPSGFTAFSTSTGLLVVNNPAIGTHEIIISYSSWPRWIRPGFNYTSGGGTVSVTATVGAWST